jgi:gluconate 5-dehydrogenase
LEVFSIDDWREVMRINLDGVFFVGQAVARHMIPRGRGKIINIASLQSEAAALFDCTLYDIQGCGEKPN